MMRGLISAIRTLTAVPIPGRDAEKMSSALPWFPVVGLLLGLVICGTIELPALAMGRTWPEGLAILAVVAGVFLTRAIHLDGLADWADGFWGSRERERVLAIMKDPHIGSFGTVAVVSLILAKWVFLVPLIAAGETSWIIAAFVISRTMPVVLLAAEPYARCEGGTAAPFARGAGQKHLAVAMLLATVLLVLFCGLQWIWPAVILAGWGFARLFGAWCRMRVGGVTGDLLGACTEIVESGVLAVGAVFAISGCQ